MSDHPTTFAHRSEAVQSLIQAELELGPGPALPSVSPVDTLSPLMQREMSRMESEEPLLQAIDTSRYRLPEPTVDATEDMPVEELEAREIVAWKAAISNARAQLEAQTTRLASLAHMQELGEEAYQCHVTQCQSMVKSLQYELFRITNQME